MIETADTDYVADYDTDYERPIMSRYFEGKCLHKPKNYCLTVKIIHVIIILTVLWMIWNWQSIV